MSKRFWSSLGEELGIAFLKILLLATIAAAFIAPMVFFLGR
jgi:hypothetical protein